MTSRVRDLIRYNEEHSKSVRLTRKAMADLERLREAYGMRRRMDVLEYLIGEGVKGLPEEQAHE